MNPNIFHDLRRMVREEMARLHLPELAVVQEQHPHASAGDDDNYACTIRLRETGLVLKRVPVATARVGLTAIPQVGDLVLVQYLGGDVNAPVITGSLYNDQDRPPLNEDGQAVLNLPADSEDGMRLEVNSASAVSTRLTIGSSLAVDLQDDDPVVHIDVGGGSAELIIESDGTVTIKSSRGLKLEGGAVEIKGTTIRAEADGEMTLRGAIINLN